MEFLAVARKRLIVSGRLWPGA